MVETQGTEHSLNFIERCCICVRVCMCAHEVDSAEIEHQHSQFVGWIPGGGGRLLVATSVDWGYKKWLTPLLRDRGGQLLGVVGCGW